MSNVIVVPKDSAESIGLCINLLLNNAQLFGAAHPSTGTAAEELAANINNLPKRHSNVSLLKNGESFYVEKWSVDHRINVQRTIGQFLKLELESITFKRGVSGIDVRYFIKAYSEGLASGKTVDDLTKELEDNHITDVLLNFITLKKVTKDQKIINDDGIIQDINLDNSTNNLGGLEAQSLAEPISEEQLDSHVFDRLGKLFSINDIVSNGSQSFTSAVLGDGGGEGTDSNGEGTNGLGYGTGAYGEATGEGTNIGRGSGVWGIPQIKEQFKQLNIEVDQGKAVTGENINYDQLFESLVDMSSSLKQNMDLQNRLVNITDGDVVSEVDSLTHKTVIQIVKKEFKSGNNSVKKLSFLIKRIAPSREELRKLLPELKTALLKEGMPISDFLELTMALDRELSSEHALDNLFKEADDFGVSQDELIEALKQNPKESAKLLLQSAEIAKKSSAGSINISEHIGKMIEDVSTSLAEDKVKDGGEGDIHTILSDVVSTVEKKIIAQLKKEDKGGELASKIESQLAERFPNTLDKLKSEWMVNTLGNAENLSQEGILSIINSVATNHDEIERYQGSIKLFRQKFGFSENEITNILSNAKSRQSADDEKKNLILLPPKNTVHMIKRYIEEYTRHKHEFSIIVASSDVAKEGLSFPEEVGLYVTKHFRVLDIAGYIRFRGKEMAVIILPMTASEGVDIILPRFSKGVGQGNATITSASVDEKNPVEGYEQLMKMILRKHIHKGEGTKA
jgi:hypothetical protein